jgi:ribosomal protein L23|tara:strand:- start:986 stop:1111 length:126 start_codon:yes stop_codon:yes gene_type:complete
MKALAFKVRDELNRVDVEDAVEMLLLVAVSTVVFLAVAPLT